MLNEALLRQLREMDAWNRENHRAALAVPYDEGMFLHMLVLMRRPERILELGTSTGFSTLWLASAATAYGGTVTTVEMNPEKLEISRVQFQKAGLANVIQQVHSDANVFVDNLQEPYDFVFMDTEKQDYLRQFSRFWPHLTPGGVVAADNAVDLADQMQDYLAHVKNMHQALSVTVPIGNGLELTWRAV